MAEKRKSLSERFGGIHSSGIGNVSSNKEFVRILNQKPREEESIKRQHNNDSKSSLTVHLKINRQRKDSSYVNRPNKPLRIECHDRPSEIAEHFSRKNRIENKDSRTNYYCKGRQIALKENFINGKPRYMNIPSTLYQDPSASHRKTGLLQHPDQFDFKNQNCKTFQNAQSGRPPLLGDFPNVRDPRSKTLASNSSELGTRNFGADLAWQNEFNSSYACPSVNPEFCDGSNKTNSLNGSKKQCTGDIYSRQTNNEQKSPGPNRNCSLNIESMESYDRNSGGPNGYSNNSCVNRWENHLNENQIKAFDDHSFKRYDKSFPQNTSPKISKEPRHLISSNSYKHPDSNQGLYFNHFNYNPNKNEAGQCKFYGLNNNIVTTPAKPQTETDSEWKNGTVSPAFSSDSSSMSLDSITHSANIVTETSLEKKPKGFYYDMSKEVFSEVENLKKIFLEDCENLKQSDQDEKTVEIIKNTLQNELTQCISNKIQSDLTQCISALKDSTENMKKKASNVSPIGQENKVGTQQNEEKDVPMSEMKFEGRTLLKGGVKPRHIPKMMVEHPELGPPTDRRIVYLTSRNLLDLPLPKWASDVLGKNVLEKDISGGINQERIVQYKSKDLKDSLKILQAQEPEQRSIEKQAIANNSSEIVCASKRKNGGLKVNDEVSKSSKVITNPVEQPSDRKKGKTDTKAKINITIGGALHELACHANDKMAINKTQNSSSNEKRYRNRSRSRDNAKSREFERSRNRSRSRDRRYWKDKQQIHKRFEHTGYRSRSREVRNRSPVRSKQNGSNFMQKNCGSMMSSIMNWHYNKSGEKRRDMFDSDRNGFRGESDDFSFIENR